MQYRRAGLYATAVAGLGTITALALAQTPPTPFQPTSVSPIPPGVVAPTTWRPSSPTPAPVPNLPRPSYFQPSDSGPVVPVAPTSGSGPAIAGPSGIVQAGAIQLPPPTIPTTAETPPISVPLPTIPSASPSALPPSVAAGPRVTIESSSDLPGTLVPPVSAGPAVEPGPKALVPSPSTTPVPAASAAPMVALPGGPLPAKQTPAISLETVAPAAVTAGADFSYELVVRNDGSTAVWGVRVEDELPAGAKLMSSEPAAEANGSRLGWTLGTVEPAGVRKIKVTLRPADEGELRTRATLSFATGTEARVKVTRPKLAVELASGETARAGEPTVFQIKLTNSGTGPANNLVLQARLSEGLIHAGGAVLELKLPALAAGQTKTFPLKVTAAKAGPQACGIVVSADGTNPESARRTLAVVEPKLTLRHIGPTHCHVKGEPVYLIEMTNPGTAGTDPVSVSAVVPTGFEFVQASDGGSLNPTTREVTWRLAGLEPGKGKAVSLKLKTVAPGDAALKTVARTIPVATELPGDGIQPAAASGRGLEVKAETALKAEGVPALRFEVVDLEDPVEVGKEAIYEIKVVNQGTGPCTNVLVFGTPAEGTTVTAATGPTTARAQGTAVSFDPVVKLDVKGEAVFRVRVKGNVAGDQKFKVQVSSDQIKTPITKEENTRFYKE